MRSAILGNDLKSESRSALNGTFKTFRINGIEGYGAKDFLHLIKPEVIKITSKEKKPIKLRFTVTPKFKKTYLSTGETEENLGYFSTMKERVYT